MSPIKNYLNIAGFAVFDRLPRVHLIAAATLSIGLLGALAIESDRDQPVNNTNLDIQPVVIPGLQVTGTQTPATPIELEHISSIAEVATAATVKKIPEAPKSQWKQFTVQPGDNLSLIFKRAGLNDRDIYELFSESKDAKGLRAIKPGQKVSFLVENNALTELKYVISDLSSLNFIRTTKGFSSKKIELTPDVKYAFRQATIDSSLFMAGKRAGLPNILTMELANIFGWDIDFALDIQKGDHFKIMYEEQLLHGKKIGTGKIVAAEFTNGEKTFKAVRYVDSDGVGRYYTPEGRGMHKAFLRTPIEFARISSHFNLNRKHPILHVIRAHKGTDYAAARGTPIRATGDGKVAFAGVKSGYGNVVILQHGQGYETLYGHLNAFAKGMKNGSRVSQGDIIGYVGMTGLASGPHLHYEFHLNGQVRDPVTVPLPKAMGVNKTELAKFSATTKTLIAQLDQYKASTRLAMAKNGKKTIN